MDIATMFNKYAFLGYEFLTWLWYASEEAPFCLNVLDGKQIELTAGKKVTIINEKPQSGKSAKVTIQGEESDLKEAKVAILDGGWISEMHYRLKIDDEEYDFTLSASEFKFSGFKVKNTGATETPEDIEGAICEKMFLITKALSFIDKAYERFISYRLNGKWKEEILPGLSVWVGSTTAETSDVSLKDKIFN